MTTPPSETAEAAVLGAMMLGGASIGLAALDSDSFATSRHRQIFDAIREVVKSGAEADQITVGNLVEDRGYLHELTMETPSAANIEAYIKIVQQQALRRHLIYACDTARTECEEGRLAPEIAADLVQRVEEGRAGSGNTPPLSIKDLLLSVQDKGRERWEIRDIVTLQEKTGGVYPGGLTILTGRSGGGKTTLCMQILANVAREGNPVYIWSCDQLASELALLLWSGFADEQIDRLYEHADLEAVCKLPLFFDSGDFTLDNVEASLVQQVERGVRWFLLDYLSLLSVKGKFQAGWDKDVYAAKRLKVLSQKYAIYFLVIQHKKKGEPGKPNIDDLGGGAEIQNAADQIWWLDPPAVGKDGPTGLYIMKSRKGPMGHTQMEFIGAHHRFQSWRG
jgi:replicative DNA helicase